MSAKMDFKWYNPSTWDLKSSAIDEWRIPPQMPDPSASYNLTYTNVQSFSFNGEKNPGGAGPMKDYKLDHQRLAIRANQAMLESDIAQIGLKKLVTWIIGKGLKIQAEPSTDILKEEGITLDKAKFSKSFEARFNLWRKNTCIDYAGQKNLNQLSEEAELNSTVCGDILVVLRVIKGEIKIQHIDSKYVQSPEYGSEWFPQDLGNGCSIIDGVEINEKREHLAYWVRTYAVSADVSKLYEYKFERIAARGKKSNMLLAYLYYGSENRINSVRGMSLLTSSFERLNNMDLYAAAALKQAQESAKVDYQQVTELGGIGTASWTKSIVVGNNAGGAPDNNNLPETADGEQIGTMTKISGIGTVYNNSPGSEIKMLENKNPLYFKEFFDTHRDVFFAVLQIPPNVAMGKYDDSYSASRAAVKDFEHILDVKRDHHYNGYLAPIVALYLDLQILQNKIQAPGYILARTNGDQIVIDCYRNVRFIGAQVPGIDPLNEVKAIREMLGARGVNLPLIDHENAVELTSGGDAADVRDQFSAELKDAETKGIKTEAIVQQVQKNTTKNKKVQA